MCAGAQAAVPQTGAATHEHDTPGKSPFPKRMKQDQADSHAGTTDHVAPRASVPSCEDAGNNESRLHGLPQPTLPPVAAQLPAEPPNPVVDPAPPLPSATEQVDVSMAPEETSTTDNPVPATPGLASKADAPGVTPLKKPDISIEPARPQKPESPQKGAVPSPCNLLGNFDQAASHGQVGV